MKKFLVSISVILALTILGLPLQAIAAERVIATFSNGDLYLKEGAVTADWHQITSGVNVGNKSLAGDRITLFDQGSTNKTVSIKEPAWNSPWDMTYWTDGSTPAAIDIMSSQLSNGQYRLLVLRTDGSIVMKDGPWNAGWWSGTVTYSGNISNMVIGGDRIGIVTDTGLFYVKQLTPGQFSHPNNTPWQLVATNVNNAKMTNDRIAYEETSTTNVYAKEGPVEAPWFGNKAVVYNGMAVSAGYFLGGDRICVRKVGSVECKQGSLGSQSILTWNASATVKVNQTRVVIRNASDGVSYLLEGPLNGPNSGWYFFGGSNMISFELN